jgi:hypothetical protein
MAEHILPKGERMNEERALKEFDGNDEEMLQTDDVIQEIDEEEDRNNN